VRKTLRFYSIFYFIPHSAPRRHLVTQTNAPFGSAAGSAPNTAGTGAAPAAAAGAGSAAAAAASSIEDQLQQLWGGLAQSGSDFISGLRLEADNATSDFLKQLQGQELSQDESDIARRALNTLAFVGVSLLTAVNNSDAQMTLLRKRQSAMASLENIGAVKAAGLQNSALALVGRIFAYLTDFVTTGLIKGVAVAMA
jgi:hypothetical protein